MENVSSEKGFNIDYGNYTFSRVTVRNDSFEQIINKYGKYYLYDDMIKNEPLISAFNNLAESSVVSEEFIVKKSTNDENEFYKKYVEEVIGDMEETFNTYLKDWLTSIPYGFQLSEMVFKKRLGLNPSNPKKDSKYNDGFIGVRKFGSRHQKTIENWNYDKYGRIESARQSDPNNYSNSVDIPYSKLMHFKIKSYNGNPEGCSAYRSAALYYYNKREIIRKQNIRAERGFVGIPTMYIPPEWADKKNTQYSELRSWAESTVKNLHSSQDVGLVLPNIPSLAMQGKRSLEFEIISGDTSAAEDLNVIIDRCDSYIAISLLSDFFLTGKTASISGELGKVKIDVFAQFISMILNVIKDELNNKFLPTLWKANDFPADMMPQFIHTNLSKFKIRDMVVFLQSVGRTGMLTRTVKTENSIRKLISGGLLPEITQEEFDNDQLLENNTIPIESDFSNNNNNKEKQE